MGGEVRVLVVDEDRDVLDLTETFLERESDAITVRTETSPEAAADRATEPEIDCVVSDLRMPGMDGLELFEEVRADDDEVPFFLLTAATDEETVTRAEQAGVTGLVIKGAGSDHYADLAERILEAVD